MSRDYLLYLEDIQTSCKKILEYTEGLSIDEFLQRDIVYDAVLRNIEIIGEAVKSIPEIIKIQYPEIDWRRIAGLRDIVIHHYFSIYDEIVWDVISNKVPELLTQVDKILAQEEE